MNIVILGCNGGTDLAYGGGTYVATAMAHCLEKQKFNVHMLSIIGLDKEDLIRTHGWCLGPRVHIKYIMSALNKPRIPFFVSVNLTRKLVPIIESIKPDLIIYNDDAPKSIQTVAHRLHVRTLAYIHFSYCVRRHNLKTLYLTTEWSWMETILNYLSLYHLLSPLQEIDRLIANSRATQTATQLITGRRDIKVLNPPLRPHYGKPSRFNSKPRMFMHAARQDKTFLENMLVEFITKVIKRYPDSKVLINQNKSRRIARMAKANGRVIVTQRLSNDMWRKALSEARWYLHFKRFEGFGVATAEAAAEGAVPLVYASPQNGSWTDLASECKYCSFESIDEALNNVDEIESDAKKREEINDFFLRKMNMLNIEEFGRKLLALIQ